jgi:hypothetical protein
MEATLVYLVTGNYPLPFETFVLEKFVKNHQHRDRQNLGWTEKMELSVRCLALSLDAIVPANNDNEMRSHG